jgi:endo-1,4-beta-xylanase
LKHLAAAAAVPFGGGMLARAWSLDKPDQSIALGEKALQKGLLYGSAVGKASLLLDHPYAELIAKQCKIVVPESEMKWKTVRPSPDRFVFSAGDWIVDWARTRGIVVHGTALAWHEALPAWFDGYVNKSNAKDILVNHIRTVVGHYAGKLHSWDVVNEGLLETGLRDTPFLRLLGPQYMDIAFQTTAEADPNAIRVYNDLYVEERNNDAQRSGLVRLLESMLSRKVPVQALGIQGHLRSDMGGFDAGKLRNFLRQVADLGLQIFITELDMRDQNPDSDLAKRDQTIASYCYDFLSTALEEKAVKVVISWGLTDRYTWLSDKAPRSDGRPVRPLPFDQNLEPKPLADAMAKAFDNAPVR